MENLDNKIQAFLYIGFGDSSSDGSGSSDGFGDSFGSGSGSGFSDGSGFGDGFGDSFGSGFGSGFGDGFGSGSGFGDGDGYGDGSGSDSGSGSGFGDGDGVKEFNKQAIYVIDNTQTIINHTHGNLAKGKILNSDLTLTPCYIIKQNNTFAHGETVRKAQQALMAKLYETDSEQAIEDFVKKFKVGIKYPVSDYYEWHHFLTGSCEQGRQVFMENHDIKITDTFTVEEFISLTENDYGAEVIKKLKEKY